MVHAEGVSRARVARKQAKSAVEVPVAPFGNTCVTSCCLVLALSLTNHQSKMLACKTVSASRGLARKAQPKAFASRLPAVRCLASASNDDAPSTSGSSSVERLPLMLASTFAPFLLEVGAAVAKDGEYGLLEGRTMALVHPAVMVSKMLG